LCALPLTWPLRLLHTTVSHDWAPPPHSTPRPETSEDQRACQRDVAIGPGGSATRHTAQRGRAAGQGRGSGGRRGGSRTRCGAPAGLTCCRLPGPDAKHPLLPRPTLCSTRGPSPRRHCPRPHNRLDSPRVHAVGDFGMYVQIRYARTARTCTYADASSRSHQSSHGDVTKLLSPLLRMVYQLKGRPTLTNHRDEPP